MAKPTTRVRSGSSRSASGSRSPRFTPVALLKLLLIGAAAVGLCWLTVMVGAASLYRSRVPTVALQYAPFDARAQAAQAQLMAVEIPRNPARVGDVRRFAEGAIARDLTVVPGWRNLALSVEVAGDRERARRLTHHAARLSRRDLPTQLWLIEERVRQDDVPGALRHYDTALRVSEEAGGMLFPVLAAAAGEDPIVPPLRAMLAQQPPWRLPFLDYLSGNPPRHQNLVALLRPLIVSGQLAERERAAVERLVQTLANREAPVAAFQLYTALKGPQGVRPGVQNGDFAAPNLLPPFDWALATGQNLRSEIVSEGDGRPYLLASAGSGTGGPVATQVLLLAPGRYRLSSAAAPGQERRVGNLAWVLTCSSTTGPRIADVRFAGAARGAVQADFVVPGNCPAQWLNLEVRATNEPGTQEAGIGRITIAPLGGP